MGAEGMRSLILFAVLGLTGCAGSAPPPQATLPVQSVVVTPAPEPATLIAPVAPVVSRPAAKVAAPVAVALPVAEPVKAATPPTIVKPVKVAVRKAAPAPVATPAKSKPDVIIVQPASPVVVVVTAPAPAAKGKATAPSPCKGLIEAACRSTAAACTWVNSRDAAKASNCRKK
jgi:hypothetical protein